MSEHFEATHETRHIVEMRTRSDGYFHAENRDPALGFDIECSIRPWASGDGLLSNLKQLAGTPGVIYHATFHALSRYPAVLPFTRLLEYTEPVHNMCLLVRLEQSSVEVAVASVLGDQSIIEVIERWITGACGLVHRGAASSAGDPAAVAADWPEYIVGPDHPLGLLSDETPCRMFSGTGE